MATMTKAAAQKRRHGDETMTLDDDEGTRFSPSTTVISMGLQHDNAHYITDT